jgi:hypothetical protein
MFCLFSNIYICSSTELNYLNLSNFNFVINCSKKLNALYTSPNYINLNIDNFTKENLNILSDLYTWIETNFLSNKFIILDDTGLDNAMIVCLYMVMKSSNHGFNIVYDQANKFLKLNDKSVYKILLDNENNIIKNNFFLDQQKK